MNSNAYGFERRFVNIMPRTDMLASVPRSYRETIYDLVRHASFGLVFVPISGFVGRELSKMAKLTTIGAGAHIEAVNPMNLLHGHVSTFMIFIPVSICVMLVLAKMVGADDIHPDTLRRARKLYKLGAAMSISLLFARAVQIVVMVRRGTTDFEEIERSLFYNKFARIMIYLVAHAHLGFGLGIFGVSLIRSLKPVREQMKSAKSN
eukprot:132130_1